MKAAARQWPRVLYSTTQLGGGVTATGQAFPGGLDLTTPSLRLPAGTLTDALNFECCQSGGYARCTGYERYDGHAAPSAATYGIVQVDGFQGFPAPGTVVTQAVSGATGVALTGEITASNESFLILTMITGAFDQTHVLTEPGPITIGTAVTLTVVLTPQQKAMYKALAADTYRALIAAVPGSGSILGIVAMAFSGTDHLYAFRANAGATAVAVYKASASGWTVVAPYFIVSFTAGAVAIPADGATLTQGGVTATIKRVMWQSGTFAGSSAVGQFVITTPSGGNFTAGAATATGGTTITLAGVQTAVTLAVGGRFEFVKTNFSGDIATRRIYGCDGVNQAFEFDGDVLAPIKSGLSPDVPSHITAHKNYLILSKGSSIMGSGPGLPFKWTATDGAWEIATGDTVNAMQTLPGDQTSATLAVALKSNTAILYGTDPTTWNFVVLNTNVGAFPYSMQNLFDLCMLDTLGVVTLRATLNFGNFSSTSLTKSILPFIQQERNKTTASTINREKSQYRLFFSDGYALYVTIINQQYMGAIPQQFPNAVLVCDETTLTDGSEAIYFGSSNGFVYQMEKGTSFDGADIDAYIVTAWDPIRSPRIKKRFRAASLEAQGEGYAEISYSYQLAYGNPQTTQPSTADVPLNLNRREYWDSFTWDEFVWDGTNLTPSDVDAVGVGENIQVIIASGSNYISAYTVNSVIHQYTPQRGMRV